ncbi:ABC transporter substrate-binding protein [Halobacterium hubeiense]|jgi:sn-glycerol 3-phosphate transport system substrate-binding protein|uniref:ABC transporter substrate-binding protein n=1 Tax=Halobacterium hubeiense TaxID=1407499 RepID=UPI00073E12DB|nr:ABC transporter substrate-binding protein [Halobacterium hubeiense]
MQHPKRVTGDGVSRRRFIAGTGAAGLGALAGCNGLNAITSGGSNSSSGDLTLDFWHIFGDELGATLEEMAAEFSDQTDGVTINAVNNGGYRDNLNQALQASRAGDPPGIVQIFEIGTRLALDSDAFTPIGDLLPEDEIDFDDFLPSVLNYYRIDGTLNSMPFNSSNTIMLYNKTAFEEAGLNPESPPRSLAEVRSAAETIVDQTDMEQGITWPNHTWMQVEQQFAKQDQVLVNNENGRAGRPTETNFNTEAGRNVYEWWKGMADAGLYLNPGIEAWGEARQAFLTGKVPMLWDSTSNMVSMRTGAEENGFELGSAYLPTPNGDNTGVVIGGGSLWVPDALSDAKKEAAGEFVAYLTQTEQQARWHRNSGYFPVRQSAIDQLTENGWFDENPNFRTAFDQLQDTEDTPATRGAVMGVFPEARTINEELSVSIVNGEVSVEEGLSRMDTQVQEALNSYSGSYDGSE